MSPIRVDFYLPSGDVWLLACRLLEKAYLRKHRIFVYCQSEKDAEKLDDLLWTFKAESFIPHAIQGELSSPIQIGFGLKEPKASYDILLNLALEIPVFYPGFERILEIVSSDEASKVVSRAHYKVYRAAGCVVNTHSVEVEMN
jgi:DNA polymerase III subunit chi